MTKLNPKLLKKLSSNDTTITSLDLSNNLITDAGIKNVGDTPGWLRVHFNEIPRFALYELER